MKREKEKRDRLLKEREEEKKRLAREAKKEAERLKREEEEKARLEVESPAEAELREEEAEHPAPLIDFAHEKRPSIVSEDVTLESNIASVQQIGMKRHDLEETDVFE